MTRSTDLVVVGGGVIGLAAARAAAARGLSVRLLERGRPGCEASRASAGMLAVQLEAHAPGPLLSLSLASRDLYSDFLSALHDASGVDVDLRTNGAVVAAFDAAGEAELEHAYEFQRRAGLPVERLDSASLRASDPALSRQVRGGLFLPREWSLDPIRLVEALEVAAERSGVQILPGREVARLLVEGRRITGVETTDGERHAAKLVVIAAGAWSGALPCPGLSPPPSEPVRGQMLCFRAPRALGRILVGPGCYLVPRSDGRVLAGSTMERVGFDRSVTAAGVATLSAAALALAPSLAEAPFEAAWAGLRPGAPDGLPVIGPASIAGLYYACSHLRNGIVLTPITARLVAQMLAGETPEIDLAPFDPARFGERS